MAQEKKWYQLSGKDADVVISTRMRLARNIANFPFPCIITPEKRAQINSMVKSAIIDGGSTLSKSFKYIELDKLAPKDLVSMVERHLISPQFAHEPAGKAMLLLEDESVSIMICEEDHLRIQVMRQGMAPDEALDLCNKIDRLLAEKLDYAFDDRLGYLTACPTNIGTAMRASVMVHIPAIEATGYLRSFIDTISKKGLVIRGMYGEESRPVASLYQISNKETLGLSDADAVAKLSNVIANITKFEREARAKLLSNPAQVDQIWRAFGVLRSARILTSGEFVNLFSPLRMGVAAGIINDVDLDTLNGMFIDVQPATLMCAAGKDLKPGERDVRRAELIRQILN